jgi:hypothetical protein
MLQKKASFPREILLRTITLHPYKKSCILFYLVEDIKEFR